MSDAVKRLVEMLDAAGMTVTFDMLRDPKWQPTREDYAALRDGAKEIISALTARAERAEAALRGLLPFVEAPYHMNACEHGYERDSIYEPCPYEKCDDRERADALDAVRTALSPP